MSFFYHVFIVVYGFKQNWSLHCMFKGAIVNSFNFLVMGKYVEMIL